MATIEKRVDKDGKASIRVKIRVKGHPPISATFARKTDAKRWAQKTEAAIREGQYFGTTESKKRSVTDMIDRYLRDVLPTRRSDKANVKRHLEWWKEQLGHYRLCDLRPPLIAEHRDKLLSDPAPKAKNQSKKRQPGTVVRYMTSLSVVMSYAVKEWGWMDENPMFKVRKPSEPRGRVRHLSDDEHQRLLEACRTVDEKYLYPIVILALSTGCRLGEILHLEWGHIDFKRSLLTFHKTKNDERRSVHVSGHSLDLLHELNKVRRINSPYVFAREDGKKPKEIRKKWEKAVKQSELQDFRFHDLRHTCASYLAKQGATLLEISAILGHKTLAMVKRYSHITEQHTAGILERMNDQQFKSMVK